MPIPALATFAAATLAIAILLRIARWLPVAQPGARSLHAKPVSRVGGLAIVAGVLAGMPELTPLAGIAPDVWLSMLQGAARNLLQLREQAHAATPGWKHGS